MANSFKILLLLAVLFASNACANNVSKSAPSAEQVFQVFMQNMALSLKNEPNCQQISAANPDEILTLGQHFATNLSVSYESNTSTHVTSSCAESEFEPSEGKLQPVWDCKIEIEEKNSQGEFVSSSMTAFYLTIDSSKLIMGSLRCF